MEATLALVVGALVTMSILLVLRRTLISIVVGLLLLGNGTNLLVFTMGRLVRAAPPLVDVGAAAPTEPFANPLPQAFVLTAIVINFGLMAFTLILMRRAHEVLGAVDPGALSIPDAAFARDEPAEEAP